MTGTTRILASLVLALVCAMPAFAADDAAHTAVPSQYDANIDRLLVLFHVRETSDAAMAGLAPKFDVLPEPQRSCIVGEFNGDLLFSVMRTHYEALFTDPAVVDQTLAYFESPGGRKLIDGALGGLKDGHSLTQLLSKDELAQLEAFAATPAGGVFLDMKRRLPELTNESVKTIAARVVAKCGPPQQS